MSKTYFAEEINFHFDISISKFPNNLHISKKEIEWKNKYDKIDYFLQTLSYDISLFFCISTSQEHKIKR